MTLTELANKYGTDKGTEHFEKHGYTEVYEQAMAHLRYKPIRLLEIGIADPSFPGASLKMWEDYFPYAIITGADIKDCTEFANKRIQIMQMDAGNVNDVLELGRNFGPFDIIIDDGAHRSDHHLTCFFQLWDYLNPNGGIYWIEDCHVTPVTGEVLGFKLGTEFYCGGKLIGIHKTLTLS